MEEKGNGPPWRTLEQISLYRKIFRLEITDWYGLEIRKYIHHDMAMYVSMYAVVVQIIFPELLKNLTGID